MPFSNNSIQCSLKCTKGLILDCPINPFKFPTSICKEMDSLIYNFWWGQEKERKNIHWVSKDTLGLPKAMGGLEFRSFMDFNDAFLVKQCWWLIMN